MSPKYHSKYFFLGQKYFEQKYFFLGTKKCPFSKKGGKYHFYEAKRNTKMRPNYAGQEYITVYLLPASSQSPSLWYFNIGQNKPSFL